jgi:hypothetical protein
LAVSGRDGIGSGSHSTEVCQVLSITIYQILIRKIEYPSKSGYLIDE